MVKMVPDHVLLKMQPFSKTLIQEMSVVILKVFLPILMVIFIFQQLVNVGDLTVPKKVQFHFPTAIVLILALSVIHSFLLQTVKITGGNYIHMMVLQSQ